MIAQSLTELNQSLSEIQTKRIAQEARLAQLKRAQGSSIGVELEGINYFADTLLFAGTVLALAKAMPGSELVGWPAVLRSIKNSTSPA